MPASHPSVSPIHHLVLLPLLLASASGCFDPRVAACAVACAKAGDCPGGHTCAASWCVPEGFGGSCGDGLPDPSADGDTLVEPPIACNGVGGMLFDPTRTPGRSWRSSGVGYGAGGAKFDVGGLLTAAWAFDLREGALSAELLPADGGALTLRVRSPVAGDHLEVAVGAASIVTTSQEGGASSSPHELPHAGASAIVDVRATDGRLVVIVTPDGQPPVTTLDVPRPAWARSALVEVYRAPDGGATGALSTLLRLEAVGPHAETCGADTLHDAFDLLDPLTWRWSMGCAPSVVGGDLVVPTIASVPAGCFVHSMHRYRMEDSRTAFQLAELDPQAEITLRLWRPLGQRSARLSVDVEELEMKLGGDANPAATIDAQVPFVLDQMRWLGLRSEGNVLIWETSPDGLAWTERHRAEVDLGLDQLLIGIEAAPVGAIDGAGRIQRFGP